MRNNHPKYCVICGQQVPWYMGNEDVCSIRCGEVSFKSKKEHARYLKRKKKEERQKHVKGSISQSGRMFLDAIEQQYHVKIRREFGVCRARFDGQWNDILIEVDGTYYHSSMDAVVNDRFKDYLARSRGYTLYRFEVNGVKEVPRRLIQYRDTLDHIFDME